MNSRTPRHRVTTLLLLAVFTSMMLIAPSARAQGNSGRNVNQSASVLMSGTTAAGDAFTGVFRIANFAVQNGQIVAQGTLTGTLTNATSGATQSVTQAISAPLVGASASCQILSLTLGPLDLNLLGLQVHLNQVVLNITAQPGPGNLLGNLLCAVANLLNGGGGLSTLLTQLTNLLNQILGAL
jgi:hypothetical protein